MVGYDSVDCNIALILFVTVGQYFGCNVLVLNLDCRNEVRRAKILQVEVDRVLKQCLLSLLLCCTASATVNRLEASVLHHSI